MARFGHDLAVEGAEGPGEDRAVFREHGEGCLVVLADGAGGTSGGAAAAEAAVAAMAGLRHGSPEAWVAALEELDARLAATGSGGETTCVVVACLEGRLVGASVGDSEAWLLNPGLPRTLTAHQRRKPLLGSGSARATGFEEELRGGRLLVATDGLTKYAPRPELLAAVRERPMDALAAGLLDLARLPSGALPDDVACVVVEEIT